MNIFQAMVLIIAIVSVASVLRAKYGIVTDSDGNERRADNGDAERLRSEVKALKKRIAVLERIATENDRGISLDREIEALRRRD